MEHDDRRNGQLLEQSDDLGAIAAAVDAVLVLDDGDRRPVQNRCRLPNRLRVAVHQVAGHRSGAPGRGERGLIHRHDADDRRGHVCGLGHRLAQRSGERCQSASRGRKGGEESDDVTVYSGGSPRTCGVERVVCGVLRPVRARSARDRPHVGPPALRKRGALTSPRRPWHPPCAPRAARVSSSGTGEIGVASASHSSSSVSSVNSIRTPRPAIGIGGAARRGLAFSARRRGRVPVVVDAGDVKPLGSVRSPACTVRVMTRFGYTLMTEQSGPRELVRYAVAAEDAGFDFEVSSDHFTPWLTSQGHSPHAWTVLGAVAHATSSVELMTYVTCPTMRYHPAVVAQQAATLQILAEGRFTLGLGSGENLNEHVIGQGWPSVQVRQVMLQEAIHLIRALHTGDLITWEGDYFRVDSARIWDTPDGGVPIAGRRVGRQFHREIRRSRGPPDRRPARGRPDQGLGRVSRRAVAQDRSDAHQLGPRPEDGRRSCTRSVPLVRRWLGGQRRSADPRGVRGSESVRAARGRLLGHPLRPGSRQIVEGVKEYIDAGFTDVALVQVGDEGQSRFLDEAAGPLLERLRAL